MRTLNFPKEYQQIMPYLIVKDAAGFMDFMKNVFHAEEKLIHMRDDKVIMHGEVTINGNVIMFAEATDDWGVCTTGLFIYVADSDTTFVNALAAGATEIMPVVDKPYGRSGGVVDPYGNTWWITTHSNDTPNS